MRKIFLSVVLATTLALTSCQFDDSALWSKLDEYGQSIKDHEQRISALEELCKQMNTNIEALQTLVDALEKRDYVTNVSEVRSNGEVIGYTISFAYSDTITIYHGKDGKDRANGADGKDGYTPQIGVMKDTDNIYYWTLDGEWLLDGKGNKIQANGVNGTDGTNGTNGVTPQLKIENDYWYVSYDNGATWGKLGKASSGSSSSNCVITKVEESETEVVFTLADGSTITLPKGEKAEVVSENNKIYYTTTDGEKLFPYSTEPSVYGAVFVSSTYEEGQGVLTFNDSITSIGDWAFAECATLATITIPSSVTSIGGDAFYGCTSLITITIPDSVTSIEECAFECCTSLKTITIPDSVIEIGEATFYDCTSLTSVYCKPTTPPVITYYEGSPYSGSIFGFDNECIIFVPKGTLADYKAAWSADKDSIVEEGIIIDDKLAEITVTPSSFATDLNGGEQVLTIASNGTWTVSCDQTDVTVEPLSGTGNGTVTVTVPAVETAREFKIVFDARKQTSVPALDTTVTTTAQAEVAVSQNSTGVDMRNYLYYENCGEDVEKIGTSWPYISEFNNWNKQGVASTNVSYLGQSASVRASGYNYQPTEEAVGLTGQPYVFLNKVPTEAYFTIENIAITGGSNYIFTYNVSCQNGYSSVPTFATVDNTLVHLELGYDGKTWDAVDCTFVENGGNGWYAAITEFKVAANATTLYARFTYEAPVSNGGARFDDFKLVEGGNGIELAPEDLVVNTSTIANINAEGYYEVKNAWVVATYAYGCLLTDNSGAYILAYSPSEIPAVGEVIAIEGAVSPYGGLLQFGTGATVTKSGETKSITHPTAEALDAAKVNALISAIEIKYVEYEGTLSISSGKYYNVTVTGTTKKGSIQSPTDDLKATLTSLNGKKIKVTGYTVNVSSNTYLNTIATSVVEVTE